MAPLTYIDTHVIVWLYAGRTGSARGPDLATAASDKRRC